MTISRKNLFAKLNATLFRSIESATTFCKLRGNPYVELVHWINQLWHQEESDLKHIARYFNVDSQGLDRALTSALGRLPGGATTVSDFSYLIELAIERAWVYTSLDRCENKIRSGHLLMAILTTVELRRALLAIAAPLEKVVLEQLSRDFDYITQHSPESQESESDIFTGGQEAIPGEASGAIKLQSGGSLAQYATDLTALAREGKIDPVLGRDREIGTMVDILLRRRQNNPLLTGDAGVGKTAVVEGLARAIINGDVPPSLCDVRLLALDIVALSAGASMKGEFEARLKAVLEEAMASEQPVILFIDEIHNLVGAGNAAGTGDAANLLKPALARGQVRTIGATTWSEFKRHIEKDPALTRRFQVLQIEEPDEESATAMLRGLVSVLETHHNVWIQDEALCAAVKLSHRYIPARQLPDKAISLLDTACARVAVGQYAPPQALQDLKYRADSTGRQLMLAEKAYAFGKSDDASIDELKSMIDQCDKEAHTLESRWLEEKTIVSDIVAIRAKLQRLSAETDADLDEKAILKQTLLEAEAQLRNIRHEYAMVHAEVSAEVVAAIVSEWTGIPVGQMLQDEMNVVRELPVRLAERVTGQPCALKQISERILTARAGLADPCRPTGVFMLTGPSGTGKTETALAIAENMYGGEHNLITINMSEYQEAHTVSALKGSPPGYVGYGEGGILTEAVRRKPYSVILLDEIEKAHPDVHELFFQVFDKGRMEDGEGRLIDFRNTIILLTSNVGSDKIISVCCDEDTAPDEEGLLTILQPELLKAFPPAFLGRLTVIPYLPLQDSALAFIVEMQLKRVAKRLSEHHNLMLRYDSNVIDYVVRQCHVAETGARVLIRFIEQNIIPQIGKVLMNTARKASIAGVIITADTECLLIEPVIENDAALKVNDMQ
ncbi:type VI secretion system ATPase TssH [Cronobacter dublinensis]